MDIYKEQYPTLLASLGQDQVQDHSQQSRQADPRHRKFTKLQGGSANTKGENQRDYDQITGISQICPVSDYLYRQQRSFRTTTA